MLAGAAVLVVVIVCVHVVSVMHPLLSKPPIYLIYRTLVYPKSQKLVNFHEFRYTLQDGGHMHSKLTSTFYLTN